MTESLGQPSPDVFGDAATLLGAGKALDAARADVLGSVTSRAGARRVRDWFRRI